MSVQRLELKTEEDSAVEEELTVSITEVEVLEEQAQQKAEGIKREKMSQKQNGMFLTPHMLPVLQSQVSQRRKPLMISVFLPPVPAPDPPLWTVPESHSNSHSDESPIRSPSKTTTLHINLASPTSEKNTSPFELRPAAANPSDSVTESLSPADETTESTEEQPEALKDQEEKEKQSELEQNSSAPAFAQEGLAQPTDQSKVRFTIATAWQRLQSPPTSPSAVPAAQDGEVKAAGQKDQDQKAEPDSLMKAELLPSPVRGRSSGSFTSKLQSSAPSSPAEPQTAEAARTSGENTDAFTGIGI
ncbi:hypothetical protein GOODEAATRI_010328 [Goodea atripinnis]|uniref:Uncharacterized protein n=1 Tax=Goodea atripinnis TaxID=208336 RepID=A0ABV0N9F7_9TELE